MPRRTPKALPLAPVPTGTPDKPRERRSVGMILQRLLALFSAPAAPPASPRFVWPTLPTGVIPPQAAPAIMSFDGKELAHDERPFIARDDAGGAPWGFLNGAGFGDYFGFVGYPILAQLSQISEYRSPCETISTEMTRKWIKFKTIGTQSGKKNDDADPEKSSNGTVGDEAPTLEDEPDPAKANIPQNQDKIEQLEKAFRDFKVQDLLRRAALIDAEFGRSQLHIGIKGQENSQELPLTVSPQGIPKGSLERLSVIEPYWTTPFSWNSMDPTRPNWYAPQSWFVMGRKTHTSRLLTFISREVPDLLKPAYNFGGISLQQLMQPYVNQWLRTRNSVSDVIHNFSTMVLSTNMQATLSGEADDGTSLFARAQLFTTTRDNKGLMLLDKASEELLQVNTPLSGLEGLQAQSQEHMCAPSHIPIVKLFGMTPSGLNNSTEDEITVFYDYIKAMQELLFSAHLDTLLKVFQLHLFGSVDDSIGYEFVPLTEQTMKELSEIRKSDADMDTAYITAGVVSPDEVRAKVQADPNSGYDNLQGEAPTPPADPNVIDPETGKPHEGLPEPDEDESPTKE